MSKRQIIKPGEMDSVTRETLDGIAGDGRPLQESGQVEWRELRRGRFSGDSADGQIGYMLMPKSGGQYFVKAYLVGGAEHRIPYQDFESAGAAKAWVEQYEQKRAERNVRYAQEEPIRF